MQTHHGSTEKSKSKGEGILIDRTLMCGGDCGSAEYYVRFVNGGYFITCVKCHASRSIGALQSMMSRDTIGCNLPKKLVDIPEEEWQK